MHRVEGLDYTTSESSNHDAAEKCEPHDRQSERLAANPMGEWYGEGHAQKGEPGYHGRNYMFTGSLLKDKGPFG